MFPVLEGGAKGSLPVVASVFDKLNQVYKEYLEAEQSYATVSHGPQVCLSASFQLLMCVFAGGGVGSRPRRHGAQVSSPDSGRHRPVGHVHARPVLVHREEGRQTRPPTPPHRQPLTAFPVLQGVSHKFIIAVLMEYIRSLNQFQIPVQVKLDRVVPLCCAPVFEPELQSGTSLGSRVVPRCCAPVFELCWCVAALPVRAGDQDAGAAQPLLHAAPVPPVPRPE